MSTQIPHPDDSPYTDADVAAIIAAPHLPMISNMNPWMEARLQRIAAMETAFQGGEFEERDGEIVPAVSQDTPNGRADSPNRAGTWTRELAELFSQCFGRQDGEPFVGFYRESSRRLIDSEYVRDKGLDLSYLLFEMKQGKPEELSSETILSTLRQQRENRPK
jgi:hypothetical protein